MDDVFAKRVSAAAKAGWITAIICAVWVTAGWFLAMGIIASQPGWITWVWGGFDSEKEIHDVMVCFFTIFKLFLIILLLASIFLTIWSRKLRKA